MYWVRKSCCAAHEETIVPRMEKLLLAYSVILQPEKTVIVQRQCLWLAIDGFDCQLVKLTLFVTRLISIFGFQIQFQPKYGSQQFCTHQNFVEFLGTIPPVITRTASLCKELYLEYSVQDRLITATIFLLLKKCSFRSKLDSGEAWPFRSLDPDITYKEGWSRSIMSKEAKTK